MAKNLKSCVRYKGWIYVAHGVILWSMSVTICWWKHDYIKWSDVIKSLRFKDSLNQVIFASSKIVLHEDRKPFPSRVKLCSVYRKSLNDLSWFPSYHDAMIQLKCSIVRLLGCISVYESYIFPEIISCSLLLLLLLQTEVITTIFQQVEVFTPNKTFLKIELHPENIY